MRIAWVGQSAEAKSANVSNIRLVNAYAEIVEHKQGKTALSIYGTPGLTVFAVAPGAGQIRGLFTAANGRCFVVQADGFYEVTSTGSVSLRGTLLTVAGPVVMEENGQTLMLVDGTYGYTFTYLTNTYLQILDPDFPGSNRVSFLDGYLVFPVPNTQRFMWTDLLSTVIDPLSFASAEGAPDKLVSQLVARRELWNFGERSTEIWFSTGDSENPFARIPGAFIQQGCAAPHSVARVAETVVWLSQNEEGHRLVMQAVGHNPQRVSTHAVEQAIQRYARVDDAMAWTQQLEGHLVYWLTFPAADATWCLDATTGLWHERGARHPETGWLGRHRANCFTFAFGRALVGDYVNGYVYTLDPETYSDAGQALVLEAVLPPLYDGEGSRRLEQTWLQVDCETGVGLDSGLEPGTDPQMMLTLSDDGGHTWSGALYRSLGKIGQTHATVEWRRLGTSTDRRCKLVISDPVKRAIVGVLTEARPLA